jgi:hypothetical protein
MYSLVMKLSLRELLLMEGPTLLLALIAAEQFYRFRSFTLQCVAFLATWLVLATATHWLLDRLYPAWCPAPVTSDRAR